MSVEFYVITVIIVILLILLVQAYRKPTVEVNVPKPPQRKISLNENKPKGKGERHGKNTREGKCRRIIENLFGDEFPTKRPSFLKNPKTGKNLKLNG